MPKSVTVFSAHTPILIWLKLSIRPSWNIESANLRSPSLTPLRCCVKIPVRLSTSRASLTCFRSHHRLLIWNALRQLIEHRTLTSLDQMSRLCLLLCREHWFRCRLLLKLVEQEPDQGQQIAHCREWPHQLHSDLGLLNQWHLGWQLIPAQAQLNSLDCHWETQ